MATFKVESGLQLLARLAKKRDVDTLYSNLFPTGLKLGEVIEIFGESGSGKSFLVMDMIAEAILPAQFGGAEIGVVVFHTDGNLNIEILLCSLQQKISSVTQTNENLINQLVNDCLSRLHILEINNATQFYITVQSLESILIDHADVSLLIFDTLTAYYWSEQGFKIAKMDTYIKNILKLVQRSTKEHKCTILYTRPQYFNSSKDNIENLEACCKNPTSESLNYRFHLNSVLNTEGNLLYEVTVRNFETQFMKCFEINNNKLLWV